MAIIRYEELFHENVVMTMEHLKLETGRPRESILRDLKTIGYYSSYNERGKFYTLYSTPEFDGLGLWVYKDAYFSARRTLLDTAEYLVGSSDAGYTHGELRRILGIGIQNSLRQLAMAGKVARRQVGAQYVYFGGENIGEQWEKRRAMPIEPIARKAARGTDARIYPDMAPESVIDILVAALRGHGTDSAAYGYLRRAGSTVTAGQVAAVFRHYGIGKKNPSARTGD
jgi:hypothetical protein